MLSNYSGLETALENRCSTSHFFLYNQEVSGGGALRKFVDVTDSATMVDFGHLLRGKMTWGEQPDSSIIGKYRAFTNTLEFTFKDDGTVLSQWTKQQTGIHLRCGINSSSPYAQQTACFHGIIWDWKLVQGEENTYQVTCYDISKLWKDYKVGSEALDSPNAFGIVKYTATTYDWKYVYKTSDSSTSERRVHKSRYNGFELNRSNAVVCKWPYNKDDGSGDKFYLHALIPLDDSGSLTTEYFQGKNYSDVISHFESNMQITGNMPTALTGHSGDTLTAQNGPWAHFGNSESAWKQLGDSVGVKFYSYYYNENGQIALVKPDAAKAASGVTRGTSESDSSKTGQIRNFEFISENDIINNPAIELTKYGVDSATGSGFPIQTNTTRSVLDPLISFYAFQTAQAASVSNIFNSDIVVPKINEGCVEVNNFSDIITISSSPTSIDDNWNAKYDGSGSIAIGGVCTFADDATTKASFIEAKEDASDSLFCICVDVNKGTKDFVLQISDSQDADAEWCARVRISSGTGVIEYKYDTAGSIASNRSSIVVPDRSWVCIQKTAIGSVLNSYEMCIASEEGRILENAYDLIFAKKRSSEYIQIGCPETSSLTCDATAYRIRYTKNSHTYAFYINLPQPISEPIGPMRKYSNFPFGAGSTDAIGTGPFSFACGFGYQNINPSFNGMEMYVDFENYNAGIVGGKSDIRISASKFQPEVHSIFTASATQSGIGSLTVESSQKSNGYKGFNEGTWVQRWLWSDAAAQDLANTVAQFNLENREPIKFTTKFNPKYKPHDIIEVTFFDKIVEQNYDIVKISHSVDFDLNGGGAETTLKLRKWNA